MKLDLKSLIENVAPEKRAELLRRVARQTAGENRARVEQKPPLVAVPREGRLPLSYVEARHWFLAALTPDAAPFNLVFARRLKGALDVEALSRALDRLVARHESLRTRFDAEAGIPYRVIDPPTAVPIERVELEAQTPVERVEEARRHFSLRSARPFDLARDRLLRVALARIAENDHALLLLLDHLVADGWSTSILEKELAALYDAELLGVPAQLPPLPYQAADFACWQREWLREERLARKVERFRRSLAGVPVLALPTDRPRPPHLSLAGDKYHFELPPEIVRVLREASRRESFSLFSALFAAFGAVLASYAGQESFVAGVPFANRGDLALHDVIGFFANEVPIRVDVSGDPTVRDLFKRSQEALLAAHEDQDVPFEEIVHALKPPRDDSQTPIFQVEIGQFPFGARVSGWGSVEAEVFGLDGTLSGLDLTISFGSPGEDRVRGMVEYRCALFDRSTIEAMVRRFSRLLGEMVSDLDARLSSLPLVPSEEQGLLASWNGTETTFDSTNVMSEIEAQVARSPEATAVVFGSSRLTYDELNRRANRLARRLRDVGVGPELIVGVCLQRSLDLVVTLLAVLKAGGAYLPLDPGLPAARLEAMLEDARATVIVASASTRAAVPDLAGRTIVAVDDGADAQVSDREDNLRTPLHDDGIAYAIFTSGSTGRPKGVVNTHGGLRNRLRWMQQAFGIDSSDVVLQKTPFGFDVSVWEFFWPLMMGARLVVMEPDAHRDPGCVAERIAAEGVTTVHFVPSMLRAFLDTPGVERCHSLRRVICSGEALPRDLARAFFERLDAELHNLYGPTEAAIDVSWWPCSREDDDRPVPIGRPVANTQLHVVDARGRRVPVGAVGELCIGGVQVARGYVNRPDLTAERFVPDPFADDGTRMYRTGDLARWRADGNIEYLGRADHQVKIRGLRIELGEIEAVLARHVREPVVVVRGEGERRMLVAYFVAAPEIRIEDLRERLAGSLPEYMVPSAFVPMDKLPLTPNGKLDRKALPEPRMESDRDYAEPTTETEKRLSAIWQELLGVPRVGQNDDFFALGGHSLLVARLVDRIRNDLGVNLRLAAVFGAPRLAALARTIDQAMSGPKLPRLRARHHQGPAPVSPEQLFGWHWQKRHPTNYTRNVVAAYRVFGALDVNVASAAALEVLRRQESLRTRFVVGADGQPQQVVMPAESVPITFVDASNVPEAERAKFIEQLADTEWEHIPVLDAIGLVRVRIVRFAASDHALVIAGNQIVAMARDCLRFGREMLLAYGAISRKEPPALATPAVTYTDYSLWRCELLQTPELRSQVAYWRSKLDGARALALPFDRQPASPAERTTGKHAVELDIKQLLPAIDALVRDERASRFAVFAAAFGMFLSKLTSQSDIVMLGLNPAQQQTLPELENLMGTFADFLVLRSSVPAAGSFRELVRRARDAVREAQAHADVPAAIVLDEPTVVDSPLSRALLNVVDGAPGRPAPIPDFQTELSAFRGAPRAVELVCSVFVASATIGFWVSSDTFERATASRLAETLLDLLRDATSNPDRTIDLSRP